MADTTKKPSRTTSRSTEAGRSQDQEHAGQAELTKKGDAIARDLDELLEEIDAVLEENAEEFVKGYVQRGGE